MDVERHGGGDAGRLATLLRELRLERDLTQEELAEASGLSVRAVRNVELGVVRRPRRASVRRLSRALNLDSDTMTLLLRASRDAGRVSVKHGAVVREEDVRQGGGGHVAPVRLSARVLTASGEWADGGVVDADLLTIEDRNGRARIALLVTIELCVDRPA